MTRVKTTDAAAALTAIVAEQAKAAAGSNTLVSKDEAKALDPVLQKADAAIRAEGGKGTRVSIDAITDRAVKDTVAVWGQFNAGNKGPDGTWLSNAEVADIKRADPALGALTELAMLRVRRGAPPPVTTDPSAVAADFLKGADFSNRAFSLPQGSRVDARPGVASAAAARATVPVGVLVGFDHFYRAEAADIASVKLLKGKVDGKDAYAVYVTTDGDDEYVELYDAQGQGLASARLWAGDDFTPDPFFGRGRLSTRFRHLDGAKSEDGMSEAAERASEGQTPLRWPGDVQLVKGEVHHKLGRLMDIQLPNDLNLSPKQNELATAAIEILFDEVLRHRATPGTPELLGPQYNGTLSLGEFVRPTDGQRYEVAAWRDVDDASYVWYFQRDANQQLKLISEQFDN